MVEETKLHLIDIVLCVDVVDDLPRNNDTSDENKVYICYGICKDTTNKFHMKIECLISCVFFFGVKSETTNYNNTPKLANCDYWVYVHVTFLCSLLNKEPKGKRQEAVGMRIRRRFNNVKKLLIPPTTPSSSAS